MTNLDSVWIVVPAYNEAANGTVGTTVRSLRAYFERVVVIDDCSSDDTAACALVAGAHVLRHPVNLGQGAALATGLRYCLIQGANIIVTFDADGQHSPEDAMAMVAVLRDREVDCVLGSRFLGTAVDMSSTKRVFLKAATCFTRLTTGLAVTDTHNGLRVFSARAARLIAIRQNRMAHASEILHEIVCNKLSFIEFPVQIVYTEYSRAKGQRMTGAFNILSDLLIRKLYK